MQLNSYTFETLVGTLVTKSFRALFAGWMIIYVTTGIGFAAIYYLPQEQLFNPSGSHAHSSFWSALHFAYTTQSTVGYGDYVPDGAGRWVAHLQALLGLVLNGLAFTIVASKVLYSVPRVRFSRYIIYHPDVNLFWFRYINEESFELIDAEIRTALQKPLSNSGDRAYDTALHILHVSRIEENLPPLRIMALKTETNNGQYVRADPAVRDLRNPSPPHLRPTSRNTSYTPKLLVTVSGTPLGSSNRFSIQKTYSVDEVVCGQFATPVDSALYAEMSRQKRKQIFKAIFDEVLPSTPERCKSCPHEDLCPLKPASRENELRFFHSIPYLSSRLTYRTIHTDWLVN